MPKQRPIADRIREKQMELDFLKQQKRVDDEREKLKHIRAERPRRRRAKRA